MALCCSMMSNHATQPHSPAHSIYTAAPPLSLLPPASLPGHIEDGGAVLCSFKGANAAPAPTPSIGIQPLITLFCLLVSWAMRPQLQLDVHSCLAPPRKLSLMAFGMSCWFEGWRLAGGQQQLIPPPPPFLLPQGRNMACHPLRNLQDPLFSCNHNAIVHIVLFHQMTGFFLSQAGAAFSQYQAWRMHAQFSIPPSKRAIPCDEQIFNGIIQSICACCRQLLLRAVKSARPSTVKR